MNLLTSSSDWTYGWNRWLAAFVATLAIAASLLFALMVVVDPYDSGHFGLLGIQGADDNNARTGNASRARDPQFDSAVIGASTAQPLSATALSRATGTHFVKLTAAGMSPLGQLATLDFFVRHHRKIGALVIVTDAFWCSHDSSPPLERTFPFWLYGDSKLDYARHLFSWRALDHVFQRIMIGLALKKRDNPDGSANYEEIWPPGQFHEANPPLDPAPAPHQAERANFPTIAMLDRAIKTLAPDIPVVLIVPPTFSSVVPKPDTVEADERQACSAALKRIVADRHRSNFIDYRIDNAWTRDRAHFADFVHYRAILARKIEDGVVASLRDGAAAKIDF